MRTRIYIVLLAALGCNNSQGPVGMPAPKPPEVTVETVKSALVSDYEDFPGRLEAVNSVEIRARVTGFLTKVNFEEGGLVEEGTVLFEIDPAQYKAELNRTEGIVQQMQGRLVRLKADFVRAETLRPKGAVSQEEYDKIVGDRTEAEGNFKVAEANRETAKLKLGWTKVVAPLTGRIGRRFIDPGNLVKEDETALTTIVDFDPIYAYFDIDERSTLRFQKLVRDNWSKKESFPVYLGLANEEKAPGSEHPGYPRKGLINFADNRVDPDTGTWRLRARFPNADRSLTAGLFVRMRMPIGEPHEAKLIAEQALGTDQGQKFVYVVDSKNKVSSRQVKVSRLHQGLRAVESGLEVGERVIVSGLQRARPGIEVTPVMADIKNSGK